MDDIQMGKAIDLSDYQLRSLVSASDPDLNLLIGAVATCLSFGDLAGARNSQGPDGLQQ